MAGSPSDCFAWIEEEAFSVGNSLIRLDAARSGKGFGPLRFGVPGLAAVSAPEEGQLEQVEDSCVSPPHACATIRGFQHGLEVERRFRIYSRCAAIACDYFFRLADPLALPAPAVFPFSEEWSGSILHTRATCVRFQDRTDEFNNLVEIQSVVPFLFSPQAADGNPPFGGKIRLTGNLLLLENPLNGEGFFLLKESPCHESQIDWPGFDFELDVRGIRIAGFGEQSLQTDCWTRGYGLVWGRAQGGRNELLEVLRCYQHRRSPARLSRGRMVQLNTWGDRSRDACMGEEFALAEIEAGVRLGVSHLMLDDGWQRGLSPNAATPGGSFEGIWRNDQYWEVHPGRFPSGLKPVLDFATAKGIEICLWFNPCPDRSYLSWQKDADVLIRLFREHGIRCFKIDGVQLPDKTAEGNLRAMFDRVLEATNGEVLFTLDVTAGKRFGYHYFNEYGMLFLENRYTDFANYYPHWTLRNLWMLAHYLPPQNFQMEFLNPWRNRHRYDARDPLAPARVPFEYGFAVTMAAQPLAWFEASRLPEEAFALAPVIRTFRYWQSSLHANPIFPIGEEPDGTRWTGFQSCGQDKGFFIIYRELNEQAEKSITVRGLEGCRLSCECLLGDGQNFQQTVGPDQKVTFQLPSQFSYSLWSYHASRNSFL